MNKLILLLTLVALLGLATAVSAKHSDYELEYKDFDPDYDSDDDDDSDRDSVSDDDDSDSDDDDDDDDDDEDMTEFAGFSSDEAETAKLTGDKQIFRDFCLQARDDVSEFVSTGSNSKVFTLIGEAFVPEESGHLGAQGARAVQQLNQLAGKAGATSDAKSAFGYMMFTRVARGEFNERIAEIKKQINSENVVPAIQTACDSIELALVPKIDAALASTKKDLSKSAAASAQFADVINETTLANVGCLTTSRLNLAAQGCKIIRDQLDDLAEVFELNQKSNQKQQQQQQQQQPAQ